MFFALFVMALYCVIFLLDLALLRALQPSWWNAVWLRRLLYGQFPLAVLTAILWLVGRAYRFNDMLAVGWGIFAVLFLYIGSLLIALLLTSPLAIIRMIQQRLSPAPSPERRVFLQRAATAVPFAGAAGVTYGLARANGPVLFPEIPLHFAHLPPGLAGLRLLHISDIHIGPFVRLDDLEQVLLQAEALRPDLVLITGDLCDYMPAYLDALRMLEAFPSPLGTFASLGNHEYIRGIRRVRSLFDQTTIPLLVDDGLQLDYQQTPLYLSAADDPRHLRSEESYRRLQQSVENSLSGAPQSAFKIVLSHRSQAFDYAANLGAELTLAGHTHGFQMGLGGRSLFDAMMPERYIWGQYKKNTSQLYTTCGMGHWLPFRFGCPPEAPLIVLKTA